MSEEASSNQRDEGENLFPLREKTDRPLIEEIARAVRTGLGRKGITPVQIHHLAVLLLGLERLPLATPGVHVSLTMSRRSEHEMSYDGVNLDESSFSLSCSGSVYDPSIGSDSYGDDVLMVEVGGYRDAKWQQCVDWLISFQSRLGDTDNEIDIECDGCEVDWDWEADESTWERAAIQHDLADSEDE